MSRAATATKTLRQGSWYECDEENQSKRQKMHGGEEHYDSSFHKRRQDQGSKSRRRTRRPCKFVRERVELYTDTYKQSCSGKTSFTSAV